MNDEELMDDKELKRYIQECIWELARQFKEDYAVYNHEADFHFDLYFLLNHRCIIFWEKKSVRAEDTIEEKRQKHSKVFDLIIYDPCNSNIIKKNSYSNNMLG